MSAFLILPTATSSLGESLESVAKMWGLSSSCQSPLMDQRFYLGYGAADITKTPTVFASVQKAVVPCPKKQAKKT